MDKRLTWFKASLLVLSLVAVLVGQRFAKKGGLVEPITSVGIAESTPSDATELSAHVSSMLLNLCSTRVRSVQFPDGLRIFEEGRDWKAEKGSVKTLDSVAVEKWLARHCHVRGQPAVSHVASAWQKLMTIEYVDGQKREFQKADRYFASNGQVFVSTELEAALAELRLLPEKSNHP
jgi:hypothetical protein